MLPQRPRSPDQMRDTSALHGIDRPIDLTNIPEPLDPSNIPDNTQSLGNLLTNPSGSTADENDDYVPESLASYVAAVNRDLEATQKGFMDSIEDKKFTEETEDSFSRAPSKPLEDEEDRVLREELLDHFKQQESGDFLSSPDILSSPPPNPVCEMTDSQIKRAALGFVSPQENPMVSLPATQRESSNTILSAHTEDGHQGTAAAGKRPSVNQDTQIWTPPVADHIQNVELKQIESRKNTETAFLSPLAYDLKQAQLIKPPTTEKTGDPSPMDKLPNQKDLMELLSSMDTMKEDELSSGPRTAGNISTDAAASPASTNTMEVAPTPKTEVSLARTDAAVSMATDALTEIEPASHENRLSPPAISREDEKTLKLGFLGDVVEAKVMTPSPLSMTSPKAEKPLVGHGESPTSVSSSCSARSAKLAAMIDSAKEKSPVRAPSAANDLPPAPERNMAHVERSNKGLTVRTNTSPSRFAAARGTSPVLNHDQQASIASTSLPAKVIATSPMTPSPLSMSSPKAAPTPQSARKATDTSKTKKSPPPQFSPPSTFQRNPNAKFTSKSADRLSNPAKKVLRSTHSEKKPGSKPLSQSQPQPLVPSSSQKQPVARFTAEMATRLSKPLSTKPSPPPPESPVRSSSHTNPVAKFTEETASRLSKRPDLKPIPSPHQASPPRPKEPIPQFTAETAERLSRRPDTKSAPEPFPSLNKSPARFTEQTAERLSRPTAAWSSAHEAISSFSIAKAEPETVHASFSSQPSASGGSPIRFTAAVAERLCKPTASRSAAIKATPPPRRSPGSPRADAQQGSTPMQRIVSSAAKALNLSVNGDDAFVQATDSERSNLSSKVAPENGVEDKPAPLPPSDHLMQATAVSSARKRSVRKPIVHEQPRPKVVSGVSSRLMTGTAASAARIFSTDDGPAKARERIRQRLQRRQKQSKHCSEDIATACGRHQRESLRKKNNVAGKENIKERGSVSGKRPLTVSKSPKFASKARHPVRPVSTRGPESTSLAQSAAVFRKGLRDDMSTGSNVSHGAHSLTIPHAPNFATTRRCGERRPPPKTEVDVSLAQSTDVLRKGLRGSYSAPQAKRHAGPTIPVAPKFHKITHREKPKSTADKEKEEMDYYNSHPFKARPLSSHQQISMPPQPASQQTPATNTIRSATFSGTSRLLQPTKSQAARIQAQPAMHLHHLTKTAPRAKFVKPTEHKTPAPFKARPAPLSTHVAPPPVSPSDSPTTPNEPFNLATASRSEKHAAVTEASRRRSEQMAQEREAQNRRKLSLREEAIQKKYEAERRAEETQRRRQVAMLQPHSIPADRKPTEPKPFQLSSAARHELSLEQQQKKLAEEEEERKRHAAFKAKPVPKTTYVPPRPIQPKPSELVDPFSPLLQSKHRAVARKEYDEYAEHERQMAEAHAKKIEEQRVAEEEEDMKERRNLPVSEGGLIPTAEPVNSVFWK